jgi:hypothetical protein
MLSHHTKLTLRVGVVCLLTGVFLGFVTGKTQAPEGNETAVSDDETPIRIVEITVDEGEEEKLFELIRIFADKWQYAIRIAPTSSGSERLLIQMWREDIKVIGLFPSDQGTLKLGFYYTNPVTPVPDIFFDNEISSLKILVNEIPNAKFTVREHLSH